MRIAILLLTAVAVLLAAPVAQAGEGARIHFDESLQKIAESVRAANQRVRDALAAGSYSAWTQAHDAYITTLVQAVPQVERTVSKFMLGTLESGDQLDQAALEAVDDATEMAALFAKQRVLTGAYATLTRRGVRPDSRGAALKLLEKQGVYALDGSGPSAPGPAPAKGLGPSPMHGRVPTTPEAAEHLSKWQYAYMRAEALGPRISSYEQQIGDLPDDAPNRGDIQARLEGAKGEYQDLLQAIQDYRRKYYEDGGK